MLTCAVSLVAFILTSNTRPHPKVSCIGALCNEAVETSRHFDRDQTSNDGDKSSVQQQGINGVDLVSSNRGQDAENRGHNGSSVVTDEILLRLNQGRAGNSNVNEIVDFDRLLQGNVVQEQEIKLKGQDGPVIAHDTYSAKSYLEKVGVIKKGKDSKTVDAKPDLYSWKLKAAGTGDKSPIAQQPVMVGKSLNDADAPPDSDKHEAGKNGDASAATGDSLSERAGDVLNGNTDIGVYAANSSRFALGRDYINSLGKAGSISASSADRIQGNYVKNNADGAIGTVDETQSGNVQSVQSILRAASVSNPGTSVIDGSLDKAGADSHKNTPILGSEGKPESADNPVIIEDYHKSIDTANKSAAAHPLNSIGNLLLRAGVITGEKNQKQRGKFAGKADSAAGGKDAESEAQSDSFETRKGKNKMCVEFSPGTGNTLFQFASAYAIAKDRNMTLAIPESIPKFSEAFDLVPGGNEVISFDQSRCEEADDASNYKRGIYDEAFLKRVTGKKDVKLRGYFQSYKYFEHWEEELRDLLAFKEDVLTKVMEAINILHFKKYGTSLQDSQTSEEITLIGVHVRRHPVNGREPSRQEGYRVATLEYIQHAMAEMRNRHLDQRNKTAVRFYVVSDDELWAEARLGIKALPDTMLVTGLSWAPTLALLASLDHVITTVGALGWWGAWLANGDVIYYQDFLEPGSKMDAAYLAQDFFPPIWTPMT